MNKYFIIEKNGSLIIIPSYELVGRMPCLVVGYIFCSLDSLRHLSPQDCIALSTILNRIKK